MAEHQKLEKNTDFWTHPRTTGRGPGACLFERVSTAWQMTWNHCAKPPTLGPTFYCSNHGVAWLTGQGRLKRGRTVYCSSFRSRPGAKRLPYAGPLNVRKHGVRSEPWPHAVPRREAKVWEREYARGYCQPLRSSSWLKSHASSTTLQRSFPLANILRDP